jgi:hypothetical protein
MITLNTNRINNNSMINKEYVGFKGASGQLFGSEIVAKETVYKPQEYSLVDALASFLTGGIARYGSELDKRARIIDKQIEEAVNSKKSGHKVNIFA